jgi:16S rRNA (cytosine1402-N4)-methyltransferase
LIKNAIPAAARRRGGHPAKRTFQAIRMEVNKERNELIQGLTASIARLKPRGCGIVISYHSGEDRIVKELFRNVVTGGCECPSKLPCVCGAVRKGQLPHSGLTASKEEIKENRRAKSARLRVLESL